MGRPPTGPPGQCANSSRLGSFLLEEEEEEEEEEARAPEMDLY